MFVKGLTHDCPFKCSKKIIPLLQNIPLIWSWHFEKGYKLNILYKNSEHASMLTKEWKFIGSNHKQIRSCKFLNFNWEFWVGNWENIRKFPIGTAGAEFWSQIRPKKNCIGRVLRAWYLSLVKGPVFSITKIDNFFFILS